MNASPDDSHIPSREWRECPHCGQLCRLPQRLPGLVADCPRCGAVLWRMRRAEISVPLACGLAALVFYMFVLMAPFLEISTYGRFSQARLTSGPAQLEAQGFAIVAALVFLVTLLVPAVKLGILLFTLSGLNHLPARLLRAVFRWYAPLSPWAMI